VRTLGAAETRPCSGHGRSDDGGLPGVWGGLDVGPEAAQDVAAQARDRPAWAARCRLLGAGTAAARAVHEEVERPSRRRPSSNILTAWITEEELGTLLACGRPAATGTKSHAGCAGSAHLVRRLETPPSPSAWLPRSRPGGPKSTASSRAASPTRPPRPPPHGGDRRMLPLTASATAAVPTDHADRCSAISPMQVVA
jgi:hypothetical protein